MSNKQYDICIIGAGPVGIFAAFYAGMRKLSVCVIDQLEVPGGQLSALYPEKFIYDVPGYKEVKAQELVDNLLKQLEHFPDNATFEMKQEVQNLEKQDDGSFMIQTNQKSIHASSIIIAGGNGGFKARPLGIENEENMSNLHYFVKDLNYFAGKKVALFGGGDSAVDWTLALNEIASEVSIIHRRDQFRAHDHSVDLMMASKANVYTSYNPKDIVGNNKIEKITLASTKGEGDVTIEVDDVICNFGFVSNLGPIKDWGLNININKIEVDSEQKTNVDGIFAIGDICTYPGKAALIVAGFGEGPTAINSAFKYINPDAKVGNLHSTSVIGGGH